MTGAGPLWAVELDKLTGWLEPSWARPEAETSPITQLGSAFLFLGPNQTRAEPGRPRAEPESSSSTSRFTRNCGFLMSGPENACCLKSAKN